MFTVDVIGAVLVSLLLTLNIFHVNFKQVNTGCAVQAVFKLAIILQFKLHVNMVFNKNGLHALLFFFKKIKQIIPLNK